MIGIALEKGNLDIPANTEISLTHTPYRFAESITDSFSNDFTVPATRHNIQILDCQGLLYANNQRYGSEIKPATLTINGQMKDARVQVVGMTKYEIQLCLYVAEIPLVLKNKKIRDFFTDDQSTIIPWSENSNTLQPQWFPQYNYGMPYIPAAAQRHPSKPLNWILGELQNKSGVTIERTDKQYYMVAQHSRICPQNPYQAIQGYLDSGEVKLRGGSHITNNIDKNGANAIEFDRDCVYETYIYISYASHKQWGGKSAVVVFTVTDKNNTIKRTETVYIPVYEWVNHTVSAHYLFGIEKGDVLTVTVSNANGYDKGFKFFMFNEFSDYEITEADYDRELDYFADWARVNPYDANGDEFVGEPYKFTGSDGRIWCRQTYEYREKNGVLTYTERIEYPQVYYSYFGYWTNIENCKITDLLFNIAFINGKKAVYDAFSNEITYESGDEFQSLTTAEIEEYKPTTDKFGQKNYIIFKGQDIDEKEPVTTIDSVYLEQTKTLKELLIAPNYRYFNDKMVYALVKQYANAEYDEDAKEWKCDFEDIEGICILESRTLENGSVLLLPIELDTNGLEKITSVMEVTMRDRKGTDLSKTDYVYVNGVKIMLTNVNSTLNPNSNENEITGIVVPEQF